MHAFLSSAGCQHKERDTKILEKETLLLFTFLEQLEQFIRSSGNHCWQHQSSRKGLCARLASNQNSEVILAQLIFKISNVC